MQTTDQIMERLIKVAAEFDALSAIEEKGELAREILRVREEYNNQIGMLFKSMAGDERLAKNPAIAAEFGEKFIKTRHVVAEIQMRWRVQKIIDNPRGYLAEIQQVAELSDQVLRWGLQALQMASSAAAETAPASSTEAA